MSFNQPTFLELKNRLNDWLRVTGGDVSNLPLDLLNRGQNKLQAEKPWSKLMFDAAMTKVEDEERTYLFPSDMITYKLIGYDSDNDGKPDEYFYREGRRSKGYVVEDNFTKSGGHVWRAVFYVEPSYPPRVRYQKQLDDFTGEGTEYSFFPGELLLRAAQLVHIEETGLTGTSIDVIKMSYQDELKKYASGHHLENADLRMEMLDNSGSLITTESTDLQGDFSGNDSYRGYDNDVDLR